MSILDTIDGTLADYDTSVDAVRWVPEEKRSEAQRPSAADLAPVLEAFGRSMTQAAESITRMFEVLQPVVQAQVKAMSKAGHDFHRALYPKQHQRCVTCHPWRKPKPLAVNGHEYHRRQLARRRRR